MQRDIGHEQGKDFGRNQRFGSAKSHSRDGSQGSSAPTPFSMATTPTSYLLNPATNSGLPRQIFDGTSLRADPAGLAMLKMKQHKLEQQLISTRLRLLEQQRLYEQYQQIDPSSFLSAGASANVGPSFAAAMPAPIGGQSFLNPAVSSFTDPSSLDRELRGFLSHHQRPIGAAAVDPLSETLHLLNDAIYGSTHGRKPASFRPPLPQAVNANKNSKSGKEEALSEELKQRVEEKEQFPSKLYRIITEAEKNGNEDVSSFSPSGGAFLINPDRFEEEFMLNHFKTKRFASSQRQLSSYGFRKTMQGPEFGSYSHPHFVKGRKQLVKLMRHGPTKSQSQNAQALFYDHTALGHMGYRPATSPLAGLHQPQGLANCSRQAHLPGPSFSLLGEMGGQTMRHAGAMDLRGQSASAARPLQLTKSAWGGSASRNDETRLLLGTREPQPHNQSSQDKLLEAENEFLKFQIMQQKRARDQLWRSSSSSLGLGPN